MPGPDEMADGLRARLSELFEALRTTLHDVAEKGGEPTGHDLWLKMVHDRISPALIEEADSATPSFAATWHLAHLTSVLLERAQIPDHGQGSGVYRTLNSQLRQLNEALTRNPQSRDYQPAAELEELEALIQRVTPAVLIPLEAMLQGQHDETTSQLGQLEAAVQQVTPAILTPLEAAIQNLKEESDEELDELEGLLEGLPDKLAGALVKSLPDAVRAIVTALKTPPPPPPPPVIVPVTFASLNDLANASASTYTTSAVNRIAFLEGALIVIKTSGGVQSPLVTQITGVIAGVLDFVDPTPLTGPELNAMTDLKRQLAPFLLQPV